MRVHPAGRIYRSVFRLYLCRAIFPENRKHSIYAFPPFLFMGKLQFLSENRKKYNFSFSIFHRILIKRFSDLMTTTTTKICEKSKKMWPLDSRGGESRKEKLFCDFPNYPQPWPKCSVRAFMINIHISRTYSTFMCI